VITSTKKKPPEISAPTVPDLERAGAGRECAQADRERADVAYLSGPAAGEIAATVLAGEGVLLESWELDRVHHRPGVGVTVGLVVHWSPPGGRAAQEYLCVTTAPLDARAAARPGVVALADQTRSLHLWRHPADPELPGLALACQPTDADLELVAYRPLRRAVVRVRPHPGAPGGPDVTYRKVVRPRQVEALQARHVLLRSAGLPVPASLGWTTDGVVTLAALQGHSLAQALTSDGASALDPQAFIDLLDAVPDGALELPRRPAWADNARLYASGAALALPARAPALHALGAQIAELVAHTDPGPIVPTHGDLYEANLLVAGAEITGLLDLDSVGPGHRVDDLACLLGHALVLPCLAPSTYPLVPAVVRRWLAAFDAVVDPAALRARVAGVVLSLVAGAVGGAVVGPGGPGSDTGQVDAAARYALARYWANDARALV
jgi:hypothetical protein